MSNIPFSDHLPEGLNTTDTFIGKLVWYNSAEHGSRRIGEVEIKWGVNEKALYFPVLKGHVSYSPVWTENHIPVLRSGDYLSFKFGRLVTFGWFCEDVRFLGNADSEIHKRKLKDQEWFLNTKRIWNGSEEEKVFRPMIPKMVRRPTNE